MSVFHVWRAKGVFQVVPTFVVTTTMRTKQVEEALHWYDEKLRPIGELLYLGSAVLSSEAKAVVLKDGMSPLQAVKDEGEADDP